MKRIYSIIALLLLAMPMLFGYNDKYESVSEEYDSLYGWDVEDVEFLRAHKDDFVGHEVGDLYKVMAMRGMKINDVGTWETSPWIDKYGDSYVEALRLYSKELPVDKGDKFYRVEVDLDAQPKDPALETDAFWEDIETDDSYVIDGLRVRLFIKKTRKLIVKKISITQETVMY